MRKHLPSRYILVAILALLLLPAVLYAEGGSGWTTDTLQGLNVKLIAIDPQQSSRIYALAPDQMFRSIDGGSNWSDYLEHTLGALVPGQFAIDPLSPEIFYAVSGERLWRSIDSGSTWEEIAPGLLTGVRWFQLDANNPNIIWAFTAQDALRSQDGGQNWASAGAPATGYVTGFAQAPGNSDIIFLAVEYQGLFRSDDGGKTWLTVGDGLPEGAYLYDLAVDPQSSDIVYLNSEYGPFRSTNKGDVWISISPEGSWSNRSRLRVAAGQHLLLVARNIYATSDNGGAAWQVKEGGPGTDGNVLQIENDPKVSGVVYVLTNLGLWKSHDHGRNWIPSPRLPGNLQLLASHPGKPERVYANSNEYPVLIQRSEDAGRTWKPDVTFAERQSLATIAWAPNDSLIAYASYGLGLLRSTDGGDKTWTETALPIETRVRQIYVSPHNADSIYVLSDQKVLYSDSGGEAWGVLPLPVGVQVSDLALSYQEKTLIYAAANNTIFRSEDGGQNWQPYYETAASVERLMIDPQDEQHLVMLTSGQIWTSHDGGKIWSQTLWGQESIQNLIRHPKYEDILFAHDGVQVFISPDVGDTWQPMAKPLNDGIATMIAGGDDPRYVLLTTWSGASWRYSFSGLPPTPTPTPTLTPTVTPTPTITPTPSPTPRPQITVVPAATPIDLDPPRAIEESQGGGMLIWLLGVITLLLVAAAVGYWLYHRSQDSRPDPVSAPPPITPPPSQVKVCSKGHTSPANSKFCMTCGERLE